MVEDNLCAIRKLVIKISQRQKNNVTLSLIQLEEIEGITDVKINPKLMQGNRQELQSLIEEFKHKSTDVQGETYHIECDIKLTSDTKTLPFYQ